MPWARIPPDKLINLPLFGIDVIADDGDFVWMSGPSGRMHVDKRAPRVFFEDLADAHQAGAQAIMIQGDADRERLDALRAEEQARAELDAEDDKAVAEG